MDYGQGSAPSLNRNGSTWFFGPNLSSLTTVIETEYRVFIMGNVKPKSLRRDASSSKKKKTGLDRKHFQQLESSEGTEFQDSEAQHQVPIRARNSQATPVGEQPTK